MENRYKISISGFPPCIFIDTQVTPNTPKDIVSLVNCLSVLADTSLNVDLEDIPPYYKNIILNN